MTATDPTPNPRYKGLQKVKPWRSEKYRAWIRQHVCCLCGRNKRTVAHHEQKEGHGGTSTKPSDDRCLPVCTMCHNTDTRLVGRTKNAEALIAQFNARWVAAGNELPETCGNRTL